MGCNRVNYMRRSQIYNSLLAPTFNVYGQYGWTMVLQWIMLRLAGLIAWPNFFFSYHIFKYITADGVTAAAYFQSKILLYCLAEPKCLPPLQTCHFYSALVCIKKNTYWSEWALQVYHCCCYGTVQNNGQSLCVQRKKCNYSSLLK